MTICATARSDAGRWFTGIGAGILMLALFSAPALAQSTRDRLATLESSVQRLERLLENNQAVQTDQVRKLQELRGENQALRNEIEKLQFEVTQGAERQRQLYLDLDQRLQALESRGVSPGGELAAGDTATPASGTTSDADSYQAAFELLKQGRYDEAQQGFKAFLAAYPESEMRGNAQYWLAETYYVSKTFQQALTEFEKVIADYPASRKTPDAWLKIGYCNYELGRWSEARTALATVASRYGETTAARLAKQRLDQMQKEGR